MNGKFKRDWHVGDALPMKSVALGFMFTQMPVHTQEIITGKMEIPLTPTEKA